MDPLGLTNQLRFRALALCLAALVGLPDASSGGLSLGLPFTDNLVLQRGVPVPLWGTAAFGAEISVEFAGQTKSTLADTSGDWKLALDPLTASAQSRTLTVSEIRHPASETTNPPAVLRLTNVLVGEVWLAAGQSNMEWPLGKDAFAEVELPRATNSLIRLLNYDYAGKGFGGRPFGSNEIARLERWWETGFLQGRWQPCSPGLAKDFSAIAYYFARETQAELGVPVGVINLAVGGSPAEAWIYLCDLLANPRFACLYGTNWLNNTNLDAWCRQRGHENLDQAIATKWMRRDTHLGPPHPFRPAFLFSAGLLPLRPFAIRGVLWYQGESNSLEPWRVAQHEELFPLLVDSWRRRWRFPDDQERPATFPFLYCQLSSISTNGGYQAANWPAFRDQQRRFLDTLTNVGMAVTSDLGHPTDVHPRNKRDVGLRLARWALARTYGKEIEFSGPLPQRAVAHGAEVEVTFSHATGGLRTSDGQPAASFELADSDGVFTAATATLTSERAVVSGPGVTKPLRIRYGWQPFSAGNLVNRDGLPASTFQIPVNRQ